MRVDGSRTGGGDRVSSHSRQVLPVLFLVIAMVMYLSLAATESTTFVIYDDEMVMNVGSGETASYHLDLGGGTPVFTTDTYESWDWDQDVWYRVDVWDEINKTLKGATVSTGDGFGTTCAEPTVPNGTYYCALPFNHDPSDVKVELEGFVTKVYDDALVYKNVPPPYNATLVRYTMKVVAHDELNYTFLLDGTSANGKVTASSSATINYVNGVAYVATMVANTFTVERTGYLTTTSASASPLSKTEQVVVTFGTNGTTCTTNASLRCDQAVKYTFKVSFYGCRRSPQAGSNVTVVNGTTLYANGVNDDGTAHYYIPVDPSLDDDHPLDVKFDGYQFVRHLGNATVNSTTQHTMEYDFDDMWGGCGSGAPDSGSSSSTTSGGTTSGGAVGDAGGGGGAGALTDTFEVTCPAVTVMAGGRVGATCTFRQLEGSTPYLDGTTEGEGDIIVEPSTFSVDRLYYYDPDLGDYTNVREVALNVSAEGLDRCTDSIASVIVNASLDTRSGELFNDTVLPVTVMSHDECHVCGDGACTGRETVHACPEDCMVCGDDTCSAGEDLTSCPEDCTVCGDGTCSTGENVTACPGDCTACGDGQCSPGEDVDKCADDCTQCGDGLCTGDETLETCSGDCAKCGDGTCTGRESVEGCPDDCAECGDAKCTGSEDVTSCPGDCTQCGDGVCTGDETLASCPADCATCGDGSCDGGEDVSTCAEDCATCGDGTCSPGESEATCCMDCGCPDGMACDAAVAGCVQLAACGDGTCDKGEDAMSCPGDCTQCGDDLCTGDETTDTCCGDCGCTDGEACDADLGVCRIVDVCGDGTCGIDETGESCPDDCAACGDGICSAGEDQVNCCADCACATGECNVLLGRCEEPSVCGDGTCDAGEALTCADDCVSCGDGTCSDGEDCCTDCGCSDEKTCDAITLRCVTVEKEKTISFRHEAVPDTGTGTGTGTGEGTGMEQVTEDEKEIAEVRQSVADVAALVTRSRAAQSGSGTGGAVSAVQVKAMVERSVEATREVDVGREVIVRNTSDGERSTVSVVVRNDGNTPRRNVRVVETIPKDVAGSAGQLAFDPPPDFVLKDDPIVGWNVDLLPGEEVTFTYTVAQDISDVVTYQRPVVIVEEVEEEPPVPACGDGTCEAGEDCSSCPGDCTCPVEPVCGDGSCEAGESKGTCCDDCGCPDGEACSDGACAPVETAAAGTPTSLIMGAVLAIIVATAMVAVVTMRKRGTVEVVEELSIAQPVFIAKPVVPHEAIERAVAVSAVLAAPHPRGLREEVLEPLAPHTAIAASVATAAVKVEAPFSTPFEGLDVPEADEDEVPMVPGHRPRIRRIDELTPEAAAEVAHGLPAPDIFHNIASKVRQLRADALHVAMSERPDTTGMEEEVAWCSSFLRTYSLVDREWLLSILRMAGVTEDVVEESERRLTGVPSKKKERGLGTAAAEVMTEEEEPFMPEEDVLKQLVDHMDLRAEALHDAMHSDLSLDTPYEERIKWIVLFLERYSTVEMDWLRYLLTMAGVDAEEVEEALDRRSVDDEGEDGGAIVAR